MSFGSALTREAGVAKKLFTSKCDFQQHSVAPLQGLIIFNLVH